MKTIERKFLKIINSRIFRRNGRTIDLCSTMIELCDAINAQETETGETDWTLGEGLECCLDDLIIGAYWALTEWHGGQSSDEYRALCAIGSIFSPGMSGPPEEDEGGGERTAYELVSAYFERKNKKAA